jgi:hypothetical protein
MGRWEKGTYMYTVGRNINWYSHFGKQDGSFEKIKNRTAMFSSSPSSGYTSKGADIIILKR